MIRKTQPQQDSYNRFREADAATFAQYDNAVLWPEIVGKGVTPASIRAINPKCQVFIYYPLSFTCIIPGRESHPMSVADIDAQDMWLRGGDGVIVKDGRVERARVVEDNDILMRSENRRTG